MRFIRSTCRTLYKTTIQNTTSQIRFHVTTRPARLRFAPSPTGFLHLGGLRTALFNHLLARKMGAQWILRIEDTDRTRFVEGALESLIKTLHWAGLDYDEGPDRPGSCGPYIQSERKHIYHEHAKKLIESDQAYPCFCSPNRLSEMRDRFRTSGSHLVYDRKCLNLSPEEVKDQISQGTSHVIRFKAIVQNTDEAIDCQDSVYGQLNFPNDTQDDVILLKADGMPTYHFANVVDDHLMHISHVLRGEEWLSSTPKHLLLYKALGFQPPNFVHLPLLVNADGSKLSKRSGDVRVEDFIAKGYEPEALLNFVALMGMNHSRHASLSKTKDETTDVMTMDEMISIFSVESISKHRSTMSQAKLDFLNQQHLSRQISSSDPKQIQVLVSRARKLLSPIADDERRFPTAYMQKVMFLMRDRLHIFSDLKYLTEYFFCLPDLTSSEAQAMKSTITPEHYRERSCQRSDAKAKAS
ncbi:uncharacterized protein MELLADRAFT_84374 [Melampsora larici-populina 98AG31]|uniref:Glutamate--tRNA ligase, mitochondrial n=1 Tax=Melampsora larici-populina (strain 98AG31 / pathotype 3-4-7) TaxID=747676 RepID=F4RFJ1_MELLP|nr:uncharacterized protein MELLADRAFT_84374 [Melampsora larici-populina 98AG31]EGG08817.1 hypothetical protein MELLADRAFT_84374 [Melampsora larici-populina 98AG31]